MKALTIKEVIFLAILSAVLLLLSALIMPLVMFTQIMVLRQLLAAPIFALFVAVALRRVPKLGALSLVGFLTGAVLLFMSLIMFINNVLAALLVELLVLLIFRGYARRGAIVFAATLYMPLTIPISLLSTMLLRGQSWSELMDSTLETVVLPLGTLALALLGALLGMKIADEMQKAGKLK